MSENPTICKAYGNCLIMSRVLRPIYPGYGNVQDKGWYKIFVIPDPRQILPYCVMELQSLKSVQLRLHSYICLYMGDSGRMGIDCLFPGCKGMKRTLHHMRSCDNRSNCNFQDCYSMWSIIKHWSLCQIRDCHLCSDYRHFKGTRNHPGSMICGFI